MKILVPIGDCPVLERAVKANIKETSGSEADVIFIKGDKKENHLDLLDKAFYEFSDEWLVVQHADLFWCGNGWLKDIEKNISSKLTAIALSKKNYIGSFNYMEHKYVFNNKKIIRTHDFVGVYNRKELVKNNLTFKRCAANKLLDYNKIFHIGLNRYLNGDDILDGSDFIGLYLGIKQPSVVLEMGLSNSTFDHAWGTFTIAPHMKINDSVLSINLSFNKCLRSLATFSWITTYFDAGELVFPYYITEHMWNLQPNKIVRMIEKYEPMIKKKLPKISKIIFSDCEFNIYPIIG